jgi:hypothetical protein
MSAGSIPDLEWRVEQAEDLARVRHELRRLVAPVAEENFVDDVVLVAHELLANCLVQTGGDCTISAWLDRGPSPHVRVEVRDTAPEQAPAPTRQRHRGLTIVDHLATNWGVERRGNGKIFWCEIGAPAPWGVASDGAGDG